MAINLSKYDFTYGGEWQSGCDVLHIDASLTMTLSILFNQNGEARYLEIKNYGFEFDVSSEEDMKVMRSMYIKVGDDYYTLDKVMEYAEKELRDILDDVEREARSDAAHAREMSSPYLTGR